MNIPTQSGGCIVHVEVLEQISDIMRGMRKYTAPPSYGMLFPLQGRFDSVTMQGVKFPLDILFLTQEGRMIPLVKRDGGNVYWRRMFPHTPDKRMPRDTYYMIEFPSGIIPLSQDELLIE